MRYEIQGVDNGHIAVSARTDNAPAAYTLVLTLKSMGFTTRVLDDHLERTISLEELDEQASE